VSADASAAATAEARTEEALEAGGYADMRPTYRDLLRRLKQRDAEAFDEATRRYRDDVVPAIAGGDEDPVSAWTTYGAWLADRFAHGRLVRLDETGLATSAGPDAAPGHVLLHLPEDSGDSAIPLLLPAELSPAQEAALELLVR